jgi:hypothetical protein
MNGADPVERAFLAALTANFERPPLLPLAEEPELDAYVAGFEQAARMIAAEFDRPDLVAKWLASPRGGHR